MAAKVAKEKAAEESNQLLAKMDLDAERVKEAKVRKEKVPPPQPQPCIVSNLRKMKAEGG
ncbi:hypothetical protein JVU11DRAFT_10898 [Chiua virens]|nr:hypothetical protein JVU11DRAFT_10898 [Chiua virens]